MKRGAWRVGEWSVGSGARRVECGEWRVGHGEWRIESLPRVCIAILCRLSRV